MMSSFQSYEASSLKTSWDKEDLLGRGSFATARRCIHDQLGRVVTKCFKVKGPSVEKVMMNVEREMKVLYRLKHQHIVAVHGITEWSNCIGIIMEYVEAGNLDDFLWLQGDIANIPLLLQLRFAHQISDGLRYLHHHDKKRSYLHCNLKPENILLTPDLMVKIADFGSVAIATATGVTGGSFTITPTTQHTPFYTAPELLRNMLSDKKPSMDVYSYGMVLCAILTRHPAFSCDDPFPPNPGLITHLIIHCGQKPKQKYLDDVESSLKDNPEDLDIFKFLKDVMVRCWDFEAKNRPDIQQGK
ncbi:receptor-interacting serine/threonine-protein kinase 1-like [Clavelina lepadiformis]|uniref:receptor-interacting serine/threonine-protein kinase 1-like n=1 Tax=Clavelina lepadiformis TaxID=159417 RepID=UPI004040ED60